MMDSRLWWKVSPKAHKCQHTPLYCEVLNVSCVQVFAEESIVGTNAKIWKRSVSGQYKCSVQPIVKNKQHALSNECIFHIGFFIKRSAFDIEKDNTSTMLVNFGRYSIILLVLS